ncbi:hypothetical protein SLA2020_436610 [Shorea laevis]
MSESRKTALNFGQHMRKKPQRDIGSGIDRGGSGSRIVFQAKYRVPEVCGGGLGGLMRKQPFAEAIRSENGSRFFVEVI